VVRGGMKKASSKRRFLGAILSKGTRSALANFMYTHKQWTVAASEDVTIALANGGIKMRCM
jgi:hypothetical protein